MTPAAAAARSARLSALAARALSPWCPGSTGARRLNLQAATDTTDSTKLKSKEDLPGPSFAKTLYWILLKGYADKSHLLQDVQRNLYGPIWRSRFGQYDLVNVATAELISQVIRQEGRYPVRVLLPHWKEYRDMRGQAYGLHVETGPEWHRIRAALNPKMLKVREVQPYAPVVHQVVSDLLQRIERLRGRSHDGDTVSDIAAELYKFGFEGISSILFETRLVAWREVPEDTLRFIRGVNDMLDLSNMVALLPRWTRSFLPHWRRFVQAWDDICDVAQSLIERRLKELEEQVQSGAPPTGLYLTYLLSNEQLSRAEVYTSITELLLGGVDTRLLCLSSDVQHSLVGAVPSVRDQRAQDRLYSEVVEACPDRREPSVDDLNQMPFLKAVIKETLRLYPVVPGNGRFVTENDLIVGGYWFPKETQFHLCHYSVCHSPDEFPDPESFVPERWVRPGQNTDGAYSRALPTVQRHHPYSYIPFGVGVRACVGKRVAEMEMYFALSRLMQQYEVRPEEGAPVIEPKTRT
uniref:Si:ch211-113j14.1 n=1 Tax=Neogobius melanostomus TaxID=47308 RepID=A0A8C6WQ06_9GOBI